MTFSNGNHHCNICFKGLPNYRGTIIVNNMRSIYKHPVARFMVAKQLLKCCQIYLIRAPPVTWKRWHPSPLVTYNERMFNFSAYVSCHAFARTFITSCLKCVLWSDCLDWWSSHWFSEWILVCNNPVVCFTELRCVFEWDVRVCVYNQCWKQCWKQDLSNPCRFLFCLTSSSVGLTLPL